MKHEEKISMHHDACGMTWLDHEEAFVRSMSKLLGSKRGVWAIYVEKGKNLKYGQIHKSDQAEYGILAKGCIHASRECGSDVERIVFVSPHAGGRVKVASWNRSWENDYEVAAACCVWDVLDGQIIDGAIVDSCPTCPDVSFQGVYAPEGEA